MLNTAIRVLGALIGAGLIGLGVYDGFRDVMPEVPALQLIYVGAALLGAAGAPRIKTDWN